MMVRSFFMKGIRMSLCRQTEIDLFFLKKAKEIAQRSKDPSTKVGSVIIDGFIAENLHQDELERAIVAQGYNGLPRGMKREQEILNDREKKYRHIIHAEENAVLFAGGKNVQGKTIYTYPIPPCIKCTSILLQCRIGRVVTVSNTNPRWESECLNSKELFDEFGIEICYYGQELI